jgi:hypothetical protein
VKIEDIAGRNWRERHGVSLDVPPADKDEITAFTRGFWCSVRDSHIGDTPRASVANIPGFVPSLRRLVDMGYGHTDIGLMFGLSRERIRQWCDRFGIAHPNPSGKGSLPRFWCDEHSRFESVDPKELNAAQRRVRARARRLGWWAQKEQTRARQVEALRALHASLGHSPTLLEMDAAGLWRTNIVSAWLSRYGVRRIQAGRSGGLYTLAVARLFRVAGLTPRERGNPGHVNQRARRFTPEQVREMRRLRQAGETYRAIGERFGVLCGQAWQTIHRCYQDVLPTYPPKHDDS